MEDRTEVRGEAREIVCHSVLRQLEMFGDSPPPLPHTFRSFRFKHRVAAGLSIHP